MMFETTENDIIYDIISEYFKMGLFMISLKLNGFVIM